MEKVKCVGVDVYSLCYIVESLSEFLGSMTSHLGMKTSSDKSKGEGKALKNQANATWLITYHVSAKA